MSFSEFLRVQVDRLGAGISRDGEQIAADACGVSDRTIRRWMVSGKAGSRAEEVGAQHLLSRAKPAKKEC